MLVKDKIKKPNISEVLRSDIEQLYKALNPEKSEYILLQTIDNDEYKIFPGTKWEDVDDHILIGPQNDKKKLYYNNILKVDKMGKDGPENNKQIKNEGAKKMKRSDLVKMIKEELEIILKENDFNFDETTPAELPTDKKTKYMSARALAKKDMEAELGDEKAEKFKYKPGEFNPRDVSALKQAWEKDAQKRVKKDKDTDTPREDLLEMIREMVKQELGK